MSEMNRSNKIEEVFWDDLISQTNNGVLTVDGWWFLIILEFTIGKMCLGDRYNIAHGVRI